MENKILIQDIKCWAWNLPHFIRKFFIKSYNNQGFVYLEKHGENETPCYCSDTVKWLDKLKIETTSEKQADKLAFDFFKKQYPEYKHYLNLF